MNATAELEFPPIDAAPPEPGALAPVATQALDLEKIDLRTLALAKFAPARKQAEDATKTLTGVVHDLSTQAKVDGAKSLRQRLINTPLADARKLTKALKSTLAGVSKAVGDEVEKVEAAFNAADALITPQIEKREAELEAERQAKAQAEAERKAKHEANLQHLAGAAQRARETGADSAKIAEGIAALEAYPITEAWEEYRERGEATRLAALSELLKLHGEVKDREEQAAENERLRVLAEQQAAELERFRKAEAERLAEEQRIAREHAELESERIAALTAGAPKLQDAEVVLAEMRLTAFPEYTEGPDAPQVLKAEAATPDATDRATPADASPSGGSMGAGQPAAAGPAGGTRIIFADPEPSDPLDDAREFVVLVLTAFNTKFPTQPKPSVEWWHEVRQAGEALHAKLGESA
jgi:hypothetical protein